MFTIKEWERCMFNVYSKLKKTFLIGLNRQNRLQDQEYYQRKTWVFEIDNRSICPGDVKSYVSDNIVSKRRQRRGRKTDESKEREKKHN